MSVRLGRIAHKFEQLELSEMSDEALIDAVAAATREEAAAAARRLALIAEVTSRWCDDEDEFSALALIDGWAQAKAQISAACTTRRPFNAVPAAPRERPGSARRLPGRARRWAPAVVAP
ncbi:hypothetical protein FBY28_4878 [Arthrobacter sp. SLBN-53]|nr:hypothetical protein FBY28_4878 [Arthrobacter sp. SLBN-53]